MCLPSVRFKWCMIISVSSFFFSGLFRDLSGGNPSRPYSFQSHRDPFVSSLLRSLLHSLCLSPFEANTASVSTFSSKQAAGGAWPHKTINPCTQSSSHDPLACETGATHSVRVMLHLESTNGL